MLEYSRNFLFIKKDLKISHSSCVHWARNGFCTSSYRTDAEKRQFCPNECGLCAGNATPNKPTSNTTPNKPKSKPKSKPKKPTNNPITSNEQPYEFFVRSLDEKVREEKNAGILIT